MDIINHKNLHRSGNEVFPMKRKLDALGIENDAEYKTLKDLIGEKRYNQLEKTKYLSRQYERLGKDIGIYQDEDEISDYCLEKVEELKRKIRKTNYNSEKYPTLNKYGEEDDTVEELGGGLEDYIQYVKNTEEQVEFEEKRMAYAFSGGRNFDAMVADRLGISNLYDDDTKSYLEDLEASISAQLEANEESMIENGLEDIGERRDAVDDLMGELGYEDSNDEW